MRRSFIRIGACVCLAISSVMALVMLGGTAGAAHNPADVPGVPTGLTAVSTNGELTISWVAPANDGGSPITRYHFLGNYGNVADACVGPATTCSVFPLTNGHKYKLEVRAVNVHGAGSYTPILVAVPGLPSPPTVTAKPANTAATVSWVPVNDGLTITSYNVTASPGGQTCATTYQLSCTFNGLTNGTAYTFAVTATDKYGTGPAGTATTTPATVPGPPLSVTGTSENSSVLVGWSAPTSNGGAPVTQYKVTASPGGKTCTSATTSCTVTGLTNGSGYTFTVTATNSAGTGPASAPSATVTPATVPGAPTGVSYVSGDGQDTISWTDPTADGGAAITGYTVTAAPGGQQCTTTGSSCTVTGLTNGTAYTFTVTASNSAGTGPGGFVTLFAPGCAPAAYAELAGCNFTDINLSGADLSQSDLTGANFTDAVLTGVDLTNATFTDTDLDGADLSGAQIALEGVAYSGVSAVGTTLPTGYVVVGGYLLGYGVDLTGVDLSGADFSGAALNYATLTDDNFTGADFTGVDLSQSDLAGSTFTDATLVDTNLDNANFTDVVLDGADLSGAALALDGASYGGISAAGTTLPTGYVVVGGYLLGYQAGLSGADLSGGDFTGAVLNYTSLTDDDFTGANLAGVDVDNTDFTGSDFTGADLDGANFSSTTLSGVTWDNTTCPDGTNSDSDGGTCVNDLG